MPDGERRTRYSHVPGDSIVAVGKGLPRPPSTDEACRVIFSLGYSLSILVLV